MPSPFPGMDPFLESPEFFPGVHDSLIFCLREALQAALPEPYYADTRTRVWIETANRLIERLADRVRAIPAAEATLQERKMFGGLAFMVNGHMCCGVIKEDLMARVGADAHETAIAEEHVRPMDFTGRPIKGMVYVAPAGVAVDADLRRWVTRSAEHARSRPAAPPTRRTSASDLSRPIRCLTEDGNGGRTPRGAGRTYGTPCPALRRPRRSSSS